MKFTLLVWEEIPENTSTYLIPNTELEIDNRLELLKKAHNTFVNASPDNDGLRFLNAALCPEEHVDDDTYFDDGFTNHNGGERIKRCEPTPREWRCVFAKYKQNPDEVIEADITRVIISGFIM